MEKRVLFIVLLVLIVLFGCDLSDTNNDGEDDFVEGPPPQNEDAGRGNIMDIAGGEKHTIVLRNDSTVWTSGNNDRGQLGIGSFNEKLSPVNVTFFNDKSPMKVESAWETCYVITHNHDLYSWGRNDDGQVGDGTTTDRNSPVFIMSNIRMVKSLAYHVIALSTDGFVYVWGTNQMYLGLGDDTIQSLTPVKLDGLSDIISVSAGFQSYYAVDRYRRLYVWGDNQAGQLGLGTSVTCYKSPTLNTNVSQINYVKGGNLFCAILKSDGTIQTCGRNNNAQLGAGGFITGRNTFGPTISIPEKISMIEVNFEQCFAVSENNNVYVWGCNDRGHLGDGTKDNILEPKLILGSIFKVAPNNRSTNFLTVSNNSYHCGQNYPYPDLLTPTLTLW